MAAALALTAGDARRALKLCAAADSLRAAIRAPLARRWDSVVRGLVVEPAREALPAPVAEEAWAAGARLPVDEAVAYALTEASAPGFGPGGGDDGPPALDAGPLSRRE